MVIAFVAVGLSFHQMNITQLFKNGTESRDLAEAAVTQAIENLIRTDGKFGRPGEPQTVNINFAHSAPKERGFLTFNKTVAGNQDIGYSTQNLFNFNSVTGFGGRVVPNESVHLVVQGRSRNTVKNLEVIVRIPTYTNALASEGPIHSPGKLIVGSIASPADLFDATDVNLAKLLPAHVASNGVGAKALEFSANDASHYTYLAGDAQAVGTIAKGSEFHIKGQERPNAAKVNIPDLKIGDFDPSKFGTPNDVVTSPMPTTLNVKGLVRHTGDIATDTLQLPTAAGKGAIFFVDGNLTLEKGIQGNGAVICTGNMTIRGAGSTNVNSDQVAAVVAGGDLHVLGTGRNASFFKGVLYSGGDVQVKDTTVMGSMVSKGGQTKPTHLENVNFIHDPTSINFKFDMPFGAGTGSNGINIALKDPLSKFYEPTTDKFDRPITVANLTYDFKKFGGPVKDDIDQAATWLFDHPPPAPDTITPPITSVAEAKTYLLDKSYIALGTPSSLKGLIPDLIKIDLWYQAHHDQPLQDGVFQMAPNRFLPLKDKMRVSLWREI